MSTINYFNGKRTIEVEVSEAVAAAYKEMLREEWRSNKRAERHQAAVSLTQMEDENGRQLADLSSGDILDQIIEHEERAEEYAVLKAGIETFTAEQRKLINLRFSKGLQITEIAAYYGVSRQAVQSRLEKIALKLRRQF